MDEIDNTGIFCISRDIKISAYKIPDNVYHLMIGGKFNKCIGKDIFYLKITWLYFWGDFNQQIAVNSIPTSVKNLVFRDKFNQTIIPGSLPDKLESLQFCGDFDKEFDSGTLPENLLELIFRSNYSCKFIPGSLPDSIEKIGLLTNYHQTIDQLVFPSNLKYLIFSYHSDYIGITNLPSLPDHISVIVNHVNIIPPNLSIRVKINIDQLCVPNDSMYHITENEILGIKYSEITSESFEPFVRNKSANK